MKKFFGSNQGCHRLRKMSDRVFKFFFGSGIRSRKTFGFE